MTDEKNPHATEEWELRQLCASLDIDEKEAMRLRSAGLVGKENPPTTGQVANALTAGQIKESTAEKLLRGAYRIPPPLEFPVHRPAPQGYITMPGPAAMPPRPVEMPPASGRVGEGPESQHWLEKMVDLAKPNPASEYVIASPMQTPVLRALRQPLYDTVLVPMNGQLNVDAFKDSKWFPDKTPKNRLLDCNLTCDGSIGYPIEFDLYYLEIVFEKFAHPEDVRRILRSMSLQWFFGQSVPWLRTTLAQFTPSFCYEDLGDEKNTVEKALKKFADQGVWPTYRHEMRTPEGKPRRISSTESFQCHIEGDAGELYAPVRIKVKMQDTLYTQL